MYRRQARPQSKVSVVALFKNLYMITGGYRCVNREKPHAYGFNHFHVCAKTSGIHEHTPNSLRDYRNAQGSWPGITK
jgi:hypothetical protein